MILGISLGLSLAILVIIVLLYSAAGAPLPGRSVELTGSYISPIFRPFDKDMQHTTYEDIMMMTDGLSESHIVGRGMSSIVYKGVLNSGKQVAIKKLTNLDTPGSLGEFEREVEMLKSIKHLNLVNLKGYCISRSENLLLYDYIEKGSLWHILHGPEDLHNELDWNKRLRIAVDVAEALLYLHRDCKLGIIHRDVKSKNILVDEDYKGHLGDFGVAKTLPSSSSTHVSTGIIGTCGYLDPSYAYTHRLTKKSDVYSFGKVLLELLTGKEAFDETLYGLVDVDGVFDIVCQDILDTADSIEPVRILCELAILCTRENPSTRPDISDVVGVLKDLVPSSPPRWSEASCSTTSTYEEVARENPDLDLLKLLQLWKSQTPIFNKFDLQLLANFSPTHQSRSSNQLLETQIETQICGYGLKLRLQLRQLSQTETQITTPTTSTSPSSVRF